jgi:hypothetical protein
VAPTKQSNPATIFLRMAIFNALGAVVFVIFYFLYRNAGGENSHYLLIAAGAGVVATFGALFAYRFFRAKLSAMQPK